MRTSLYTVLLSTLCAYGASAQNLVPNPSFEEIGQCPINHGQSGPLFNSYTVGWFSGNIGSPDLFTACSGLESTRPLNIIPPNTFRGHRYARTGDNFLGLYHYGLAEYAVAPLLAPLEAEHNYAVRYHVAAAGRQRWITDAIGVHFSDTILPYPQFENPAFDNVVPQVVSTPGVFLGDTAWTAISGVFTANGGERYMTLGCFFTIQNNVASPHVQDLGSAIDPAAGTGERRLYYFFDDISVERTINGPLRTCANTEITYTAPPKSEGVTWTWTLPEGWVGESTDSTITLIVGSTAGTLVAVASNGDTHSIAISVDNTVPAAPEAIFGDDLLCAGTARPYMIAPVEGASSYAWELPEGWSGHSTDIRIEVAAEGGTDTLRVRAVSACGTSAATSLFIAVGQMPAVPSELLQQGTLCAGDTAWFSVAAQEDALSYSWTLPTGWSFHGANNADSVQMIIGANSGDIRVAAVNGCGSSATLPVRKEVLRLPSAFTSIEGPDSLCAQSTSVYRGIGGSAYTSVFWQLPEDWTGASDSLSIELTSGAASDTLRVVVGNACGTSDTTSMFVEIAPLPLAPIFLSAPDTLCAGAAATWTIEAAAYADGYTWYIPEEWVIGDDQLSVSGSPSQSMTIGVDALNACGNSVRTDHAIVLLSTAAAPSALSGTAAPCVGDTVLFTAAVEAPNTLHWSAPAAWSIVAMDTVLRAVVGNEADSISVFASGLCGNSDTLYFHVAPVTPNISLTSSNDTVQAVTDGEVIAWFDCATNTLVQEGGNRFIAPVPGNYRARYRTGDCEVGSDCIDVHFSGSGLQGAAAHPLRIRPNPSNGRVWIELPATGSTVHVRLFDTTGRMLRSQIHAAGTTVTLDLSGEQTGLYLVRVNDASGSFDRSERVIYQP